MPLVHVVAAVVILVVLARTIAATARSRAGRPGSLPAQALLAVVSAAVVWQALMWLNGRHEEATSAFRLGVLVQLVSASAIVVLCLAQIVLDRRGRTRI